MNSMGAQAVLAVLLLTIGTVEAADVEGVSFWRTNFTMTCPGEGNWYRDKVKDPIATDLFRSYTLPYNGTNKGVYYCEYSSTKYYFYVQGKVCENCFELDAFWIAVVIVADLIFTVFVIMTIYRCTKKKSPPAPVPHSSKATPRSGGRGPNVGAEYETLNQHTRGNDTYSKLNRTG